MNYGEELTYWYLRLNGFFLIQNFVVHRTDELEYSSDIDLLAIRFPHVYEEVGGRPEDWHDYLLRTLDFNKVTGIICEVKTGDYEEEKLFKSKYINYSLRRFGFKSDIYRYTNSVKNNNITQLDEYQIVKLFVSNNEPQSTEDKIFISLQKIREFIETRLEKYNTEKWQDRIFFHSNYLQSVIDRVHNDL
ncbi:MAG: hypothetical protein ACOCRK_06620 [bacterium]